jgi:hypothetical protein
MSGPPRETITDHARVRLLPLAGLLLQLALTMAVIHVLAIEDRVAFDRYFSLLLPVGFLVHAVLPLKFRLPFFVALTIGLIIFIFKLTTALYLLIGAGVLIGVCHLPVPFSARVGLLTVLAVVLGVVHAGAIEASDRIRVVIPALGAIFMFRLALYLFELKHEKQSPGWWTRLAYFFLLPNPVFTLFPVVDYKTFQRTYYNQPAAEIYQKGVLWMARGAFHFVLYRLVTNYLSPPASEVSSLGPLLVFLISSYLIYLRMSGLFHLIVGMLCLFGFNLPETHRFYLLASGFNDYWQRINIYWKDLMTKLVYYPVFMRVKRLGTTGAVMASTAAVFFATWILHAYQSFWMRADARVPMFEDWGLFTVDALFWGSFGVLVMINSYVALRSKPAPKSLKKKEVAWSTRAALARAVQIGAMLVLMCLLWSLWQSPTVSEWLSVMGRAGTASGSELLAVAGAIGIGLGLGVLGQYLRHRGLDPLPEHPSPSRARWTVLATMAMLLAIGLWNRAGKFSGRLGEVADAMQGLDVRPEAQMLVERGYYEGLLTPLDGYTRLLRERFGTIKVRDPIQRPEDFPDDAEAWSRTGDLRHRAYKPNADGVTVGAPWRSNEWGQRDQPYTKEKPPGVYRIAMLGASYTMGRGVAQDRDFESVFEDLLNEPGAASQPVEVLNFAVTSYSVLENALVAEQVIPEFQPDAMFYVAHGIERSRCARQFVRLALRDDVDLGYEFLQSLVRRARLDPRQSNEENLRRLEPFADELMKWGYEKLAAACRERGIIPVYVFLPTTERAARGARDLEAERPVVEAAGFKVLAIDDPYLGKPLDQVVLNPWDSHPGESSHGDIGRQLFASLRRQQDALQLGFTIHPDRPPDHE